MDTPLNANEREQSRLNDYSLSQAIVNYYLVIMFTAFPLFFTNAYFNIRHDKYHFFLVTSLAAVAAVGLIALTPRLVKRSPGKDEPKDASKSASKPWYKALSFTDKAVIAFWGVSLFSTLLSSHPYDALFGTAGRNNGLLLITFYAAVYFMITRSFKYKDYIFIAFAAGASAVFLLSILNCFYIDPLGMFEQLALNHDSKTISNFTSTIGNKNLMSSFICIALPVMTAVSVYEKNRLKCIAYNAASALGFMALMTADSDSGVLGIGVFLAVYSIICARKINRLKRYFFNITIMLLSAKLIHILSLFFDDNKGFDAFQEFFVFSNGSYILIAIFALLSAALCIIDRRRPDLTLPRAVPICMAAFFALCAAAALAAVFYFSAINTECELGSLETILRFNEKWGTHRGYMWIKSADIFADMSFLEKLIGTGPDTYYYAFSPYFSGLMQYGDGSTNAAHNEYINYLVTVGILGLASYLAVVFGCIARALRASSSNFLLTVPAAAVICYSVQAVVNISQPITTPLFFIFIALCEAFYRNKDSLPKAG